MTNNCPEKDYSDNFLWESFTLSLSLLIMLDAILAYVRLARSRLIYSRGYSTEDVFPLHNQSSRVWISLLRLKHDKWARSYIAQDRQSYGVQYCACLDLKTLISCCQALSRWLRKRQNRTRGQVFSWKREKERKEEKLLSNKPIKIFLCGPFEHLLQTADFIAFQIGRNW